MTDESREVAEWLGLKQKWIIGKSFSGEVLGKYEGYGCDFSDDAGAVQLLRLMESRKDGKLFFAKLFYAGDNVEAIDDDGYIDRSYITTRGKLLDAVWKWMKKEKG